MHTDTTLEILSQVTMSLGTTLRQFEETTCSVFQTRELVREQIARQRRQEKRLVDRGPRPMLDAAAASVSAAAAPVPAAAAPMPAAVATPAAVSRNARKPKSLNLKTYKYHALGDYVSAIQCFGTTDSYSTQPVSLLPVPYLALLIIYVHQSELEHRTSKARFLRTNGRSVPLQLSKIERRQHWIRSIREKMSHAPRPDPEDIVNNSQVQYNIGRTQKLPVHVPTFLRQNAGDPATKASIITPFILPMYRRFNCRTSPKN
jgi:hypothetical protein